MMFRKKKSECAEKSFEMNGKVYDSIYDYVAQNSKLPNSCEFCALVHGVECMARPWNGTKGPFFVRFHLDRAPYVYYHHFEHCDKFTELRSCRLCEHRQSKGTKSFILGDVECVERNPQYYCDCDSEYGEKYRINSRNLMCKCDDFKKIEGADFLSYDGIVKLCTKDDETEVHQ